MFIPDCATTKHEGGSHGGHNLEEPCGDAICVFIFFAIRLPCLIIRFTAQGANLLTRGTTSILTAEGLHGYRHCAPRQNHCRSLHRWAKPFIARSCTIEVIHSSLRRNSESSGTSCTAKPVSAHRYVLTSGCCHEVNPLYRLASSGCWL